MTKCRPMHPTSWENRGMGMSRGRYHRRIDGKGSGNKGWELRSAGKLGSLPE